ncbi:MAG TPA: NAD-dependent epimerase/dehydratase family protein, partial [Rubrobacteraceae bacterium]|nr:NAD-dependent epimerase/dehydratase family protein [Rubrobacteraceae bacterium]
MKLLITGGAGYIGSVVSLQLVKAGHEVTVLDNLSKGHEAAVPEGAKLVRADLLDAGRLAEI